MRVPSCGSGSGRDHDEWVARLGALAQADAAPLVPRPEFPVYGLAGRSDGDLMAAEPHGEVWAKIELTYGDPLDPAGPYLRTRSAGRRAGRTAPAHRGRAGAVGPAVAPVGHRATGHRRHRAPRPTTP